MDEDDILQTRYRDYELIVFQAPRELGFPKNEYIIIHLTVPRRGGRLDAYSTTHAYEIPDPIVRDFALLISGKEPDEVEELIETQEKIRQPKPEMERPPRRLL